MQIVCPFSVDVARCGLGRASADCGSSLLYMLASTDRILSFAVATFLTPTRLASDWLGADLSLEGALWRRFFEKMRSARASFFFRSRPERMLGEGHEGLEKIDFCLPSLMIFSKSVATLAMMEAVSRKSIYGRNG